MADDDLLDTRQAAELLLEAYRSGPIPPLTQTFGEFTLEQAYQIQLRQVEQWQRDGRVIKGHKVGLTSLAMRRQIGVDQSDYGHLTDAERYWFGCALAGDPRWADVDFDMVVAPDQAADQVIADYRSAIADSDEHIRAAGDLDTLTARPVADEPRTLRWVIAHMTGETVRHAGHADILRELIDGVTGR